MNMLTTPAIGAPNSFLRRVQVDPTIAAELWRQIERVVGVHEGHPDPPKHGYIYDAMDSLSRFANTFRKLHNLEPNYPE